jgi:hypothetical protein
MNIKIAAIIISIIIIPIITTIIIAIKSQEPSPDTS